MEQRLKDKKLQKEIIMKRTKYKLSTKLISLVIASIAIFLIFASISYHTLNRLRVNGQIYHQIVQGKDLVADILPPPEYIIEAYLVTLQILGETQDENIKAFIEKGKALKNDYLERHKVWVDTLPAGRMKDILVQQSYTPAMAFFDFRDNQFIPAIRKGDKAKATELAFGAMHDQYELHRRAIDEVVKSANELNANIETEAASIIKAKTILMFGIALIGILGLCVLAFVVIRSITGPLTEVISGLTESAEQVTSAAGQVSSASQQLAEGSSEQAASIEETSSSLEEMSAMTKQNADNAQQADTLMKDANQVVEQANDSMSEMTTSMSDISKASEETSKIIKTIDEIAFQTNLLALNAAVEAARAGEAGAGFAVVADEVRNLAMRAADAAKNTAELIEGTVKKTKAGTELVTRTNEAFSEVAASAVKVGELVGEIAAASNEQSQGIGQVNTAVAEMDKVVQQNAANAEESASASEEMNAQAEQMKSMVAELAAMVGGNSQDISLRRYSAGTNQNLKKLKNAVVPFKKASGKGVAIRDAKVVNPEQVIPMEDEAFKDF
jgi:methyl-accepting chemotaxis protein